MKSPTKFSLNQVLRTAIKIDKQTDRQTDRHTDRQTHRQTDTQTDTRTGRQTTYNVSRINVGSTFKQELHNL